MNPEFTGEVDLMRKGASSKRLALQPGELFNKVSHPNFGPPTDLMTSPLFGQSTQMLEASLGRDSQNGGLNPLDQIGGPTGVADAMAPLVRRAERNTGAIMLFPKLRLRAFQCLRETCRRE
jgi:hypothetical protein